MGRNHLRAIVLLALISAWGALFAQPAPRQDASAAAQDTAQDNAEETPQQQAPQQDASAPAQDSAQDDAQQTPPQQAPPQGTAQKTDRSLVVNGKTVNAQVVNVDGRFYVDIDSLAQIALITNGTMTIEPNRIALNIPVQGAGAAASSASSAENETAPASAPGLSKGFVSEAIAALAEMREWRGATETMITYGLAVSPAWAQGYHDRAQEDLTQATVMAMTDDDRDALTLLRNEFDKLSGWSADTLAAREALNGAPTIDPNTLQNDPQLAQINSCGEFLSSMLLSGTYSDNASCH